MHVGRQLFSFPASLVLFTLVALSIPVLSAQSRRPAAARVERPVPYAVGERLAYDVSWSNYLTAGTVTLAVESKRPSYNSIAYYVVAEAQTTGMLASLYTLYYKADTLIDAFTMLPQRGSVYSREGRRERMKTTMFDHGARRATFEMRTSSTMEKTVGLGISTQDALSALYALRTIAPKPGESFTMPVSDSGWLYHVRFAVGQAEPVRTATGATVQALRVVPSITGERGQAVPLTSVFWLAADGSFRPVRLEGGLSVGRIVMTLK
jgi:hypothetical protein